MTVEIPEILVERLQGLGPHFVKVLKNEKRPFEEAWQKPENLMDATDLRLQKWLAEGGNYGVVGGFGLVIVDVDTDELKQIVREKLPATFTVRVQAVRAGIAISFAD